MVRNLPAGCRLTAIFDVGVPSRSSDQKLTSCVVLPFWLCSRLALPHLLVLENNHDPRDRLSDLPWIYNHEGKVKEPNVAAEVGQGLLGAVTSYARHDMGGVFQAASGIFKTATGGQGRAQQRARQVKSSAADVVSAGHLDASNCTDAPWFCSSDLLQRLQRFADERGHH